MVNENDKTGQANFEDAKLDRALDAALAKYTAVEPQAGLEDRILAGVRAEQAQLAHHHWLNNWRSNSWRWVWAVAAAAVVIVAIGLVSRPAKRLQQLGQTTAIKAPRQPEVQSPQTHAAAIQSAANMSVASSQPRRTSSQRNPPREARATQTGDIGTVAANPRLEQFPSPRPLSEQEKMLLEYVQQNPEEAAMIAQAQTAFAQQEERQRSVAQPGDANPQIREQPE
jgi:hypothetical protein